MRCVKTKVKLSTTPTSSITAFPLDFSRNVRRRRVPRTRPGPPLEDLAFGESADMQSQQPLCGEMSLLFNVHATPD
jgi:hypothetical protein